MEMLNVNKLKTVPIDLTKLSDIVDNDIVKKQCMISLLQYLIIKS